MLFLSFIPVLFDKQSTEIKKRKNVVHNKAENDYLSMCLSLLSFFSSSVCICLWMPVNTYIYSPPFLFFFGITAVISDCLFSCKSVPHREKENKICILIDLLIRKTVNYYHRFNCLY